MTVYYVATSLAAGLAWIADCLRRAAARRREGDSSAVPAQAAWFAFLASMPLILVGALRWRVGVDYWSYEESYRFLRDENWRAFTPLSEPGLRVIARVGAKIVDDSATMFAIAAALTTWLSIRTMYRTSPAFALSVLLFVLTGPWLASFNAVRQCLAAAIVFAGHQMIIERRFWRYAAVVFTGGLFHVSAYLLILLYFVPRRRLSWTTGGLVLGAGAASTLAYGEILNLIGTFREGVGATSESYFYESVSPIRIIVALAPVGLYLFIGRKSGLSENDNFYIHMLLVDAAIMLAASGSAYVARFSLHTALFVCVALPRVLPKIGSSDRTIVLMVMIPLYGLFWYVETVGISALVNFNWIFERSGML